MPAPPDYGQQLNEIWGWPDELYGVSSTIALASNVVVGTNPAYAATDFLAFYPQFTIVPVAVLNAYITLASASLVQARYDDLWTLVMGYFVAHYCTLWLQASANGAASTVQQAAASGLAIGIKTSKSAGDVSVSSNPLVQGLERWGSWNLTLYGQMLLPIAAAIGSGPMLCV